MATKHLDYYDADGAYPGPAGRRHLAAVLLVILAVVTTLTLYWWFFD